MRNFGVGLHHKSRHGIASKANNGETLMHRLLLAALAAAFVAASTPVAAQSNAKAPQFAVDPTGPSRCPTTGSSARSPASPSTGRTTSGSSSAPLRWPTTRRARGSQSADDATAACRRRRCCEFDRDGKLLRAGAGRATGYDWPKTEHGIHVDTEGNVWVAGNGNEDHQILKFTPDGKFLLQIGKAGTTGGSNEHDAARAAGPHGASTRQQRALRRRRLRQPARRSCSMPRPAPTSGTGAPMATCPPTTSCRPTIRRRRVATVRQPRALRAPVARRPRLRLRPRQQPHPGVRARTARS